MKAGSITFSTELDNKILEQELVRLKRSFLKLEESIGLKKIKRNDLEEQLNAANEALAKLQERTKITGSKAIFEPGDLEQIRNLQAQIPKLEAEIRKCDAAIQESNLKLENTQRQYGEIVKRAQELRAETQNGPESGPASGSPPDRRTEIMERQQQFMGQAREQLLALVKLTSEAAGSVQEKLAGMFGPLYEKMSPALVRIRESLADAFRPLYEKLDLDTVRDSIRIGLDGIREAVSGFAQRIAPDMQYAAGSIALGLEGILERIQGLPSAIRDAAEGFASFSVNIGPVISAALPSLDRLVGVLKSIGSTAVKALGTATKKIISFGKGMNVLSKLSDAVGKKLKRLGQMIRRVFVFSVITSGLRAIRTQISSYLSLNAEFSTALSRLKGVLLTAFQPIYDAVVPALTTLLSVLSQVIAAISQFTSVLFGTTAKQAQKNAEALYNQAAATEAAGSAAEDAAGSLAGFDEINPIQTESSGSGGGSGADADTVFDWEYEDTPFPDWGEAFDAFLDKILNVGIPQLKDAFSGFADWLNDFSRKLYDMFTFPGVKEKVNEIGKELANSFEYLADKIEWETLGRALGAGLNTAISFLNGFIYGGDSENDSQWMRLGKHLAEAVNGLVDEVEWYEFGRLLWGGFKIGLETLAGFILGLNMPKLAEAASDIVKGFFDEMTNTIERIPWDEVGAKIAEFLTNLDWPGMFESVYNAVTAVLEAIRDFFTGFLTGLGEWTQPLIEIVNTIIDTLEKLIDLTIEWAANLNLQPILEAFSNLTSAISEGLLWAYENVLLPLAKWGIEEAVPAILDLLASAIEALTKALDLFWPVAEAVWTNILQPLGSFVWDVITGALEVITNILQKLTDLLRGNVTFSDFLDSLAPGEAIILGVAAALGILETAFAIGSAISAAGALIAGAITGIGTALAFLTSPIGIVIAAITFLVTVFTLLYQHVQPFRDFIDSIIEWAKQLLPGIAQGIAEGWEALKEFLSGIWQKIVDGFKSFFGIHSPSTVFAELARFLIEGLLQGISETWSSIVEFFGEKLEALKQTLSDAWNSIRETAGEVWEAIKNALGEKWESIKASASEAWENLKTTIGDGWENIKTNTGEKWEAIKTVLGSTWDAIKSSASDKFTAIKDTIVNVWNTLKTATSDIWNGIWGSIKGVINTILGGVEGLVNGVISGLNKMISALNKLSFDVPDWVPVIGGGTFGFNIPSIPEVSIPRLAQGAVIPANREFLAVLGDQSNGRNLEAPEGLIRQIVREESGGGDYTALLQAILEAIQAGHIIMVDRRILGQTVKNELDRRTRSSGRSAILT